MNIVYLALGSNLHRHQSIKFAIDELKKIGEIKKISTVYESIPLKVKGPNFFNLVIKFKTNYQLKEFYDLTKVIENRLGRDNWLSPTGSIESIRCLDIDILMFNELENIDSPKLPREDIFKYDFVFVPLFEIEPNLKIVSKNIKLSDIAENFSRHQLKVVNDFL